jgi:hypothetical protein
MAALNSAKRGSSGNVRGHLEALHAGTQKKRPSSLLVRKDTGSSLRAKFCPLVLL